MCVLSPVTESCRLFFFFFCYLAHVFSFLLNCFYHALFFFFLEVKIRSTERQVSKGKEFAKTSLQTYYYIFQEKFAFVKAATDRFVKTLFSLFLFILFLFTTRRDNSLLIVFFFFAVNLLFFFFLLLLPFLPVFFFLIRFYLPFLRTSDIPFLNCAATLAVQSKRERGKHRALAILGYFPSSFFFFFDVLDFSQKRKRKSSFLTLFFFFFKSLVKLKQQGVYIYIYIYIDITLFVPFFFFFFISLG